MSKDAPTLHAPLGGARGNRGLVLPRSLFFLRVSPSCFLNGVNGSSAWLFPRAAWQAPARCLCSGTQWVPASRLNDAAFYTLRDLAPFWASDDEPSEHHPRTACVLNIPLGQPVDGARCTCDPFLPGPVHPAGGPVWFGGDPPSFLLCLGGQIAVLSGVFFSSFLALVHDLPWPREWTHLLSSRPGSRYAGWLCCPVARDHAVVRSGVLSPHPGRCATRVSPMITPGHPPACSSLFSLMLAQATEPVPREILGMTTQSSRNVFRAHGPDLCQ